MAKLIKFPLEMEDGTKARSIEELREHADIASLIACYKNGKLQRWLLANCLDDEVDKIKSINDSDNKRCMESKQLSLKDIVTALGISSINEAQIAEYDFNEAGETLKEKLSGNYAVEIEDDAELKSKLKSLVSNNEIDLDEWKICMDKSEKENSKVVCIQNKNSGLFVSFDLKDDETLNKTIISSLKNLKKLKSVIDSTATGNCKNTQQQPTDLSAFEYESVEGECVLKKLRDSSLKHVVIPDIFTEIGNSAFENCISLERIELPNSIKKIRNGAFCGCSNLESIELPNSITWMGKRIFKDCTNLKSIMLPDSVKDIGNTVFENCTNLENIEIPNSVKEIGAYAFSSCSNLKSVKIPNSVKEIGANAFSCCSNLKSVEIPDSVTAIGVCAFARCSNLESVKISNSVNKIGNGAFLNCSNLKNVVIPDSLKIDWNIFEGCPNIVKGPSSFGTKGDLFGIKGRILGKR